MDAKHTPGPFEVRKGETVGAEVVAKKPRGGDYVIARCGGKDREANARLFAAAPDLLDACERLLSYEPHITEAFAEDAAVKGDMKALRAAIARARGEG